MQISNHDLIKKTDTIHFYLLVSFGLIILKTMLLKRLIIMVKYLIKYSKNKNLPEQKLYGYRIKKF